MKNLRLTSFLLLASLMLSSTNTYAQEKKEGLSTGAAEPLADMFVVLGAGAAGAILGLSTLSFVDEPSKNWRNVSMGGAIGIILGVGIVIFNQATKTSSEIYSNIPSQPIAPSTFESLERREFAQTTQFDSFSQANTLNFSASF